MSSFVIADLLLVRGDPTEDVSLARDQGGLAMIMKDGVLFNDLHSGSARLSEFLVRAAD